MSEETDGVNMDPFSYYRSLARLKRFVEESYGERITVARAARIAGLAEKYFSTFFHQNVGVTFAAWLRHYRISRAKSLLRTRDLSITEVAFEVGFSDASTFSRAFKACEKTSPRQFRKRIRTAQRTRVGLSPR